MAIELAHAPPEKDIQRALLWDKLYYTPFSISRHSSQPVAELLEEATQQGERGDIQRTIQLSRTILKDHHDPSILQDVVKIMTGAMARRAGIFDAVAQQENERGFVGQMNAADDEVVSTHAAKRASRWARFQEAFT